MALVARNRVAQPGDHRTGCLRSAGFPVGIRRGPIKQLRLCAVLGGLAVTFRVRRGPAFP